MTPGQLALDDAAVRPVRGPGAPCRWCHGPIPELSETGRPTRSDALTCCKDHRQADWRFGYRRPPVDDPAAEPMRFGYADPPYPGCSRYYRDHPDFAGEVDHRALLDQLAAEYPDGWALSTSSRSLGYVVTLLEARQLEYRIGAWTFPRSRPLDGVPNRAWEPVIFSGGRPLAPGVHVRDHVHAAQPRALPGQVIGAKPSEFAWWLFGWLGAMSVDELDDLYPGSGAIGRAWRRWTGVETNATAE